MPVEDYIERLIIRQDHRPEVGEPSFEDEDCDSEFEFDGVLVLKQIIKSIQNATHNRHDYVFNIKEIRELKKV